MDCYTEKGNSLQIWFVMLVPGTRGLRGWGGGYFSLFPFYRININVRVSRPELRRGESLVPSYRGCSGVMWIPRWSTVDISSQGWSRYRDHLGRKSAWGPEHHGEFWLVSPRWGYVSAKARPRNWLNQVLALEHFLGVTGLALTSRIPRGY